jgi:branched-chain amino acid transport system ATP-binding protein
MRSISGLLTNQSAQVSYQGDAIGALRADQVAQRGIALVPEGRQLFPSLSVEENLLIGAQTGRAGPWSVEAIYSLFPILKERRSQASTTLSGGQQQMVAIGRALMANPDVILFDEISLGLAPVIIKSIYDALPQIVGDGMTALIVEQDISKALSVSSRVYCLQEGRVSLSGKTDTVTREDITRAYFGVDA